MLMVIGQRVYGCTEQKGSPLSPLCLITWAAACPGRTPTLLYSWATNERVPNVTVIPDYPEKFKRWQVPCLCSLNRQDEREERNREGENAEWWGIHRTKMVLKNTLYFLFLYNIVQEQRELLIFKKKNSKTF